MSILELFCSVDECWVQFEPQGQQEVLASGQRQRRRAGQLYPSELMTILILFQPSHYRPFKAYYIEHVQPHWRREFPGLVSYSRLVERMPSVLVPLVVYWQTPLGECTGLSCIDSTALKVCHPARIKPHRVFQLDAARGKTSVGWFYGFKLPLVVNDRGEWLAFCLTPGHVDERQPVPRLARRLFGQRFGDRGYLSQDLAQPLFVEQGLRLITKLRKHMHQRLIALSDKLRLRKRAIIESIGDLLKNECQIEPSRHRRPVNFLVHLAASLIAYCHLPKKPHLDRGVLALRAA